MFKFLKKHIGTILCIVLSVCVYFYSCVVVTPKDINDSGGALYYNGMGFLAENENTLDIVMYGNSNVYSGFSPAVLFDTCGFTSYASGRQRQTVENINGLLRKTLKTQNPKLVILEMDCLFEEKDNDMDGADIMYAPFVYHSRWKEIKPRDFYTLPNRTSSVDVNKGYINSNYAYDTNLVVNYMGDVNSSPAPISQENLREVNELLSICQKNNIDVMFLVLPSASSWTYAKHNAVNELAKQNNIPFLDLNTISHEYGFNLDTDFRDNGSHLNRVGAYKASVYVSEYLRKNYSSVIENKQGNPNYAQWEKVIENYKNLEKQI